MTDLTTSRIITRVAGDTFPEAMSAIVATLDTMFALGIETIEDIGIAFEEFTDGIVATAYQMVSHSES